MIYFKLIFTNLRRHRARTSIGLAGVAFSVAAMLTVVSVLQGAIGMFEHILSSDSEFIVFERNASDLFFSNVPEGSVAQIATWSCVEHVRPVLFGIVSSPGQPIITCFGVTRMDSRVRDAVWLSGNRARFGDDARGVVLGERAASFLSAKLGSTVPIGRESFTVVGVIKSANGFEDGGVFMPLSAAQEFFHKEGVSSVATVKLKKKEEKELFRGRVEEAFPHLIALENEEFSRSYSEFKILKATAWAVGCSGLILGGLGVANTMIMSVFTRIREIAILRVNGFSGRQIAALILGESMVVALVGAFLGVVLGNGAVVLLKWVPVLHGYVNSELEPLLVVVVIGLACLTSLAGAFYPAFYAMRVRPVEALRFE